ncbi:hypothetical protein [Caldibacillus debilis]|uniref:hypothetical protein n=1 Tax=Caldibacillus debilis TaxID=301148 RepID=UPI0012902672|nr:hypothetical protein [Caldibacillus debilis]
MEDPVPSLFSLIQRNRRKFFRQDGVFGRKAGASGMPARICICLFCPVRGRQGARKATFFRRAGTRMRCLSLLLKKFLFVSVPAPRHGRSERIGRFRPLMKKHAPFAVLEFPNGTSQRFFFIDQNIRGKDDVIGQRLDFKPDDFRFHRPKSFSPKKSALYQILPELPNSKKSSESSLSIFSRQQKVFQSEDTGFPCLKVLHSNPPANFSKL